MALPEITNAPPPVNLTVSEYFQSLEIAFHYFDALLLIVALLAGILGYLFGRYRDSNEEWLRLSCSYEKDVKKAESQFDHPDDFYEKD
jgi:hypothetical protein